MKYFLFGAGSRCPKKEERQYDEMIDIKKRERQNERAVKT